MVSPTLGVGLLTVLVTPRSAVKVVNVLPTTRSESVAVREVEERVSTTKLARSSGRPRAVRSMPPSKNSPGRKVEEPLLSRDVQPPVGALPVFTIAKMLGWLGSTVTDWREPLSPPDPT